MSGTIEVTKVLKYFGGVTNPHAVLEELVVKPLKARLNAKSLATPSYAIDEDLLDSFIELEKTSLVSKLKTLRDVMIEKKLDKITHPFHKNVSTFDEIQQALYGEYMNTV
jgi:hypothetical protein